MPRTYQTLFIDGNLAKAGDDPASVRIGDDVVQYFSVPGASQGLSTPEKTVTVSAFRRFKTLQDAAAGTNPVQVGQHTKKYHLIPSSSAPPGSGRLVEVNTKIAKENGTFYQTSFRASPKATIAAISAFIATWGATNRPSVFSIEGRRYPVLTEAQIKAGVEPPANP